MHLSPGFWENFEVGLIFFFLEIVIISMLIPLVLERFERRKWKKVRSQVALHLAENLARFAGAYRKGVLARGDVGYFEAKNDDRFKRYNGRCRELRDRMFDEIEIFSFCIEPDMAQPISEIRDCTDAMLRYFHHIERTSVDAFKEWERNALRELRSALPALPRIQEQLSAAYSIPDYVERFSQARRTVEAMLDALSHEIGKIESDLDPAGDPQSSSDADLPTNANKAH